MVATYDLDTEIGKMRLMITDTDIDNPMFQDEEIQQFLSMTNNLYEAASLGWGNIAGSKSLLAKKKTTSKYSHDLTLLAKACREQSDYFKKLDEDAPAFGYAEMNVTDFAERDIIINEILRGDA